MCCGSSAVTLSPSAACIVKAHTALATVCLVSSVALLALTYLQVYELLLPGYIAGGVGLVWAFTALICYCRFRKPQSESGEEQALSSNPTGAPLKPQIATPEPSLEELVEDPKNPLLITQVIYIPPSRLPKQTVMVHPEVLKSLESSLISVGGAVYTAIASSAIPEGGIGMSVPQKEQLRRDLGLPHLDDSMEIVLESFKPDKVNDLLNLYFDVEFEEKKNQFLISDSMFISKVLSEQLEGQILKKGQTLSVEVEGIVLKLSFRNSSFTASYGKITRTTEFFVISNDLNVCKVDEIPTLSDVEGLEFTPISGGFKKIEIPEEVLPRLFLKLATPSKLSKTIQWVPERDYWRVGEQVSVRYNGEVITFALNGIKLKGGKSASLVQAKMMIDPSLITIKDYLKYITVKRSSSTESAKSAPSENSSGETAPIEIPKDEIGLTVVQRLEKRGVGGLPTTLNEIFQPIIDMRVSEEKETVYSKWGFKRRKGLLLEGPPGTGKSSLAKHIGEILGCEKHEIKIAKASDLLSKWVGETEAGIKELFTPPKGSKFFLVIIDEVESLLSKRENHTLDHQGSRVGEFLSQFDGIIARDDFFIIGITNKVEKIDKAFLRPGRFGDPVRIDLPTKEGRETIFEIYLKPLRDKGCVATDVSIKELAEKTDGFSGAQIEEIVNLAKKRPMEEELSSKKTTQITQFDLLTAIGQIKT